MTRLVVSGASGRMGRAIARLAAESPTVHIVGGIVRVPDADLDGYPRIVDIAGAASLMADADVLLDVSRPEGLAALLDAGLRLEGKALVVGTTGLGAALEARLDAVAEHAAVLVAANFSLGVHVLLALVARAAALLDAEAYDAEIVETHHSRKADAPSGTALALAAAVAGARQVDLEDVRRDGRSGTTGARRSGEIGIHALRGGGVVGEHHVHFLADRERIELVHVAQDRDIFAEGALRAATWLAGRAPGRYTMSDVLGL
jgi:4-hydroxy-tetrahydrodipicolinate reductase